MVPLLCFVDHRHKRRRHGLFGAGAKVAVCRRRPGLIAAEKEELSSNDEIPIFNPELGSVDLPLFRIHDLPFVPIPFLFEVPDEIETAVERIALDTRRPLDRRVDGVFDLSIFIEGANQSTVVLPLILVDGNDAARLPGILIDCFPETGDILRCEEAEAKKSKKQNFFHSRHDLPSSKKLSSQSNLPSMTLLLSCQALSKSYATRTLFEGLDLSIFSGERIGLIGPNGAGKSTLLKIIASLEVATSGTISARKGLRIGYVAQSCDFPDESPTAILLSELADSPLPDYEKELLVKTWLSKLGFIESERSAKSLSGGWKKRLSFACAFIKSPDVLLLDEPTNHLDLEGILWLEKFLLREEIPYLIVSHDRTFLQNIVNRVVEINPIYPHGLFSIEGSYLNFLEKKEAFLQGQLEQERSLASKARRELDWLRTSPKARTSKSKSRIEEAHELLDNLSAVQQRNTQKRADIDFAASERETRKLLAAKNIAKARGEKDLFRHLDLTLSPGTRIGLMGPNGSGKTTLLKILAGEIQPDQGTIKTAENLQIVTFDQHRAELPLTLTLREALSPKGDYVHFRGQKIHVNGWCKRFLFSPDLLDMPLAKLSGGERARISIAHLMLQPADILLLDEPTNDLDIATLETLEDSLIDFPGAVVLITHDRCLLDRICNSLLALGDPEKNQIFADFAQWQATLKSPEKQAKPKSSEAPRSKPKLSYAEKKEYDQIEAKILQHEQEIQILNQKLEDPTLAQDPAQLQVICSQVALAENHIEQLYLRWQELEQKQQSSSP
jgi:ATP-binding cassette subfamily F protein uup